MIVDRNQPPRASSGRVVRWTEQAGEARVGGLQGSLVIVLLNPRRPRALSGVEGDDGFVLPPRLLRPKHVEGIDPAIASGPAQPAGQATCRYRGFVTGSEYWSDDAIAHLDQDRFSRTEFARLVAKTIDAVPLGAASTVFGIVGPWGSGKSSVAAMVGECLPGSWIVQPFTPWAATGVVGLQLEFVAALDTALGGSGAEEQAARAALKKYVRLARPLLAAVPGVGDYLAETAEVAVSGFAERKPWSTEFGKMAESLEVMERRVLVVCDDIDRLDASELLEFLKVVRLLGRFPNVHYLVAYDADTVEDLLAAQGVAGRTASFMEKIVQHPFELPKVDSATRWSHASAAMSRTLEAQQVELDESGVERYRSLLGALTSGLTTPRQLARFEQHMSVLSQLVPGEVDLLDFAAVAYLRLNHHEVYDALPTWTPQLQAGLRIESGGKVTNEGGLTEEGWVERISQTSRRPLTAGAWEVLQFLYPNLGGDGSRPLHPQAFADYLYEERYFTLGVPENDVSDVLVARAVSSLLAIAANAGAEAEVKKILTDSHASITRLAITKMRRHRSRLIGSDNPIGRLVAFLHGEYLRLEPEKDQPDSPVDLVFDWLSEEVVRGYVSSEFDRDGLVQRFGEEIILGVLLRASAPFGSSRDTNVAAMLSDFADHFLRELDEPGVIALEPWEYLRLKLSLVERALGGEKLDGLLDGKVDGDPLAFEQVATALVRTAHWRGSRDVRLQLEFEGRTWSAVVSEEVRKRMAAFLPSEFDDAPIDTGDVSDDNRRRIAIVRARSEFGPNRA